MLGRTEVVFETLRQMQCFFDDNETTLGALNQSGARKRLDETVAQLTAHAVAQIGGRRVSIGETAKQGQLRLELRFDHMRPIALIASQKLREQPEFTLLRLPSRKARGLRLTAAARDMANAAEQYTDLFVEEGLAPDFVAELRAAADRLDQSIDARGQGRGARAGATEGLKVATARARVLIRLFDSLLRPKLATNDALRREWQAARHIQRLRTTPSAPSVAETPEGAAPTAGLTLVPTKPSTPTEAAA